MVACVGSARADDIADMPHLRPLDNGLHQLVEMGIRNSPSFRALVNRLSTSDVVVYIRCGRRLRAGLSGQLTFLGTSAGIRYVVVAIQPDDLPERKIATLGHELQHAVEVADTPSIVDTPSLGVAYSRMGRSGRTGMGTSFDTTAAIDTGAQVWREIAKGAGDRGE